MRIIIIVGPNGAGKAALSHATPWRSTVEANPGRIPDGEPSDENVLAVRIRARDHAPERAAAVRRSHPPA